MTSVDTYRKQAKLLLRWHGEGNYSVGGRVRLLERYRHLADREVLDMAMPLALAQEIVAVEAGFANWASLKAGAESPVQPFGADAGAPVLGGAVPILFVRDVSLAAAFYRDRLDFDVDFLHGKPPFYGSVSRDKACLHLRLVHDPNFAELADREPSLVVATIEATNVKALFDACKLAGVEIAQPLVNQAWGGIDFHVRDPDGNVISFVQYRRTPA